MVESSTTWSTPGYPRSYESFTTATWVLKAQDPDQQVKLVVVGGRSEECCDKLEVYSNKTKLGEVSGLLLNPREFKSIDGRLDFYFRSDYVREYPGFHGYFQLDTSSDGFVLTASEEHQNFTTPGFPLNYGKKTSFECQIRAPQGMQVHFLVVRGQTEACCDKLEIRSNDVLIGTVSGQITAPKRFVSTNGILDLRFYSDSALEFEGIYAEYKVATDDLLEDEESENDGAETCIRLSEARYAAKTLSTPNYPDSYPPYAYCEWKISAPEGKQVKLYLVSGRTEPEADYLKIWVNGSLFYEVSGNLTEQKTFTSLNGTLVVKFYADEQTEMKGFHGYYEIDSELDAPVLSASSRATTISSPGYPYERPFESTSRYELVAPAGQQVEFTLCGGQPDSCCVEVYSGDGLIANVSGSVDSPRTFSSTNGSLTVLFCSPEGATSPGYVGLYNVRNRSYVDVPSNDTDGDETDAETIDLYSTDDYSNLLSPNYPGEYRGHADYTWNIRSRSGGCEVELVFVEIETEACCDLVEVLSGDSLLGVESGSSVKRKSYSSAGGSLSLKFFSDGTRQFKGFLAYYHDVCELVERRAFQVTETVRFFSTPGHPHGYAPSESFTWKFVCEHDEQVYFSIVSGGSEACCDFVEVFSGNRSLGRTSGKVQSPMLFASTGNSLTVKFSTDRHNQGVGFSFSYVVKPKVLSRPEVKDLDGECGFEAQATHQPQYFLMPECWSNSSRVTACKWTLTAPPGFQVALDVEAEDYGDCCELLRAHSANELVSGTATDAANKKTYGSSDGTLVVKYTSRPSLGRSGYYKGAYHIKWPCDRVLPVGDKPTTFETPGYPDSYQNGLSCQWKLVAPAGRKIRLTLVSGESEECCDKLEVISDGCVKEEVSGSIRTPKRFESDGNELIVRFKSDQNGVYSGFTGYYSLKPSFRSFSFFGSTPYISSGNSRPTYISSSNVRTNNNNVQTNNNDANSNNDNAKDDDSSSDSGWSTDGWSVSGGSTSSSGSSNNQNSASNVQDNQQSSVQNTQNRASNTYINTQNSPSLSFGYGSSSFLNSPSYLNAYYNSYYNSYYGGNSIYGGSYGNTDYGSNSFGSTPRDEPQETAPLPTFFDNVSAKKRFGFAAVATDHISEFTTPNYPKKYPSDMYGEWVLTAEEGAKVNFTVLDGASECCCDRMEVFVLNF